MWTKIGEKSAEKGKILSEKETDSEIVKRFIKDSDLLTDTDRVSRIAEASPEVGERITTLVEDARVKIEDDDEATTENEVMFTGKKYLDGDIITDGSHIKNGQLMADVTYKSGEHDYYYHTNNRGLIETVYVEELKYKEHDGRLRNKSNTYGKLESDDAGHLIGDRFGGSRDLDNLVSQAREINRKKFKEIEDTWAKAIKNGQKVSVNIDIEYSNDSVRPSAFVINYSIGETKIFKRIEQ